MPTPWISRILYLEGLPNLQRYHKVTVGQTVLEQLQLDYKVEEQAIALLNNGIKLCREQGDNGSRELLESILLSEEHHANWIEEQLHLIDQVGLQNYLSQQIH